MKFSDQYKVGDRVLVPKSSVEFKGEVPKRFWLFEVPLRLISVETDGIVCEVITDAEVRG